MTITVFDTPGLADGTGNDQRYLRQIYEKVNTVDLFLFCTDMPSTRFSNDDANTIKKVTETFGARLWDNAMVVLTFANRVDLDDAENDQQRISLFQNVIKRFQEKIQNFLLREGVPQETASNLPFVPAGKVTEPRLPDRENWLTALWITTLKHIDGDAKADFVLANLNRISISRESLLPEYTAETERTKRGGERECFKVHGIDNKRECQIQYSLPPAHNEGVSGNQVALPMDESSSQALVNELLHESIKNKKTGDFFGASASLRCFRRRYAALFARIMDFVRKLLRGKIATKTKECEGRQKENAEKF